MDTNKKTSKPKHPSLPIPGTSKSPGASGSDEGRATDVPEEPWMKRCCRYMYNRETKEFCGRTCRNWFYMFIYMAMYLIFLATYTMIFLYASLMFVKYMEDYQTIDKLDLLTYSANGIGLTATPTSLNNMPLIWYRNDPKDYRKYIDGLENLLNKRRKREVDNFPDLGPCGKTPFGYGNNPCVIIRINKQLKWSARPLNANSTAQVPPKVQDWLKMGQQKLWLHCEGHHSYDKEHIGKIKYFPDPPGFDPKLFPLGKNSHSPLIAIQISEFTLGVSLAIQCKLWYEGGNSAIEFLLYVTPKRT